MKRTLIAVALLMLLIAVATQARAPAPNPGPEHKKLEIWIGDWTYEGEYYRATLFGPAGKCTGKVAVRPILGGFFVEFRSEEKGAAGTTEYLEINGDDPVARKYIWHGFDSQGLNETVTYTIEGNTVAYAGSLVIGGRQAKSKGYPDWDKLVPNRFASHFFMMDNSEAYRRVSGIDLADESLSIDLFDKQPRKKQ